MPLIRARTTVSDRSELSEDALTGEQGSLGVPDQTERRVAYSSGRPSCNLPFFILIHEVAALLSFVAYLKTFCAVFSAAATTWSIL